MRNGCQSVGDVGLWQAVPHPGDAVGTDVQCVLHLELSRVCVCLQRPGSQRSVAHTARSCKAWLSKPWVNMIGFKKIFLINIKINTYYL